MNATRLRKWLNAKRGRAYQLARALGCAPSYINQLKRGVRPIPDGMVEPIKRAMGGR